MTIEISGRNFEVNDKIRDLINAKLEKIKKFFDDIIEIRCVLNVEMYRNICEIIILGKEHDVTAIQEAESMEEAITSTIDHLKVQAQKNREKIKDHHRKEKGSLLPDNWQVNVLEPGRLLEEDNSGSPRIIKTSNLPIRPMSI